jgi:hypothetical protein
MTHSLITNAIFAFDQISLTTIKASLAASKIAHLGAVSRVPAADLEDTIVKALDEYLLAQKEKPAFGTARLSSRDAVLEQVARIDVHRDRLVIRLRSEHSDEASDAADTPSLSIP